MMSFWSSVAQMKDKIKDSTPLSSIGRFVGSVVSTVREACSSLSDSISSITKEDVMFAAAMVVGAVAIGALAYATGGLGLGLVCLYMFVDSDSPPTLTTAQRQNTQETMNRHTINTPAMHASVSPTFPSQKLQQQPVQQPPLPHRKL